MDEDPVSGGFQHRAGASVSTSTTIPPTRSSNAAHGVPPLALTRNHAHEVLAIPNLRRISPSSCQRRTCGYRLSVRSNLLRISLDHTPSRSPHRKHRFSGASAVRTFRSLAESLLAPASPPPPTATDARAESAAANMRLAYPSSIEMLTRCRRAHNSKVRRRGIGVWREHQAPLSEKNCVYIRSPYSSIIGSIVSGIRATACLQSSKSIRPTSGGGDTRRTLSAPMSSLA